MVSGKFNLYFYKPTSNFSLPFIHSHCFSHFQNMIKIRTIHRTQVWGWKGAFLTHPGTAEGGRPTGTCPLGPVYRLHCWDRSFGSRACKSNALDSQGPPQSHLKCRRSSACGSSCSTVLRTQTHTWINEQTNDDWMMHVPWEDWYKRNISRVEMVGNQ